MKVHFLYNYVKLQQNIYVFKGENFVLNNLEEPPVKSRNKFQFPHVFIILFGIIVLVGISSYFIPAGEYERVTNEDGREIVVEGTYHAVESSPPGFFDFFLAVPEGMLEGGYIIFFILIVGGSFGILLSTNAIEEVMASLTAKMSNREIYIIPVVMAFFALGGATFGMSEETIPFMLILIPMAIRMGFDSMVGAGMVLVGAYSGFTAAFLNPFTVGVAQSIAGLPLFSGMGTRVVFWFLFVGISTAYVMIYAKKVKKDPKLSIMYDDDRKRDLSNEPQSEKGAIPARQILIMVVLAATLVGLALGVTLLDWYTNEIAALFLIMGIVVGVIAKMRVNEIAENFVKGCESLVNGALVVGFAYGILVVLQNSNTIDTILHGTASIVGGLPASLTAIGMFMTQSFLNFLIPSGSGQAALTMPIMAPLADLVGVSRQTAVLAFQLGDGITNLITPTSGAFMAALAIAQIPWVKWVRWIWPLILIQTVVGAIFITIAHLFIW